MKCINLYLMLSGAEQTHSSCITIRYKSLSSNQQRYTRNMAKPLLYRDTAQIAVGLPFIFYALVKEVIENEFKCNLVSF